MAAIRTLTALLGILSAQIEMAMELELPARFLIAFARSGSVRRRCEKVWQTGTIAGLRFVPAPR